MTPAAGHHATGTAPIVDALSDRTGLDFTGPHQERMDSALEHARREAGAPTHADLAARMAQDPDTYAGLVDRLTVGETYFFREPHQIELVRTIVSHWSDQPAPRRVWSAGCATGEEPYTLAIVLDEAGLLEQTQVVATDLSRHAVERARLASYGEWSLRRCDQELRHRYFDEHAGRYHLHRRFVDAVEFRVRSLTEGPPVRGAYDVVLCRNVLIYLHGEALQQAAIALRDSLRPDGRLIMGSSDPALRADGLELVRSEHGLHYRRTSAIDRRSTPPRQRRGPARDPAPSTAGSAPAARRPRQPDRRQSPEPQPAAAAVASTVDDVSESVSSLIAKGDSAGAERLVAASLADQPLDAGVRVLDATLHLYAGRHGEAATAATAALYLDPDLVVAHLLLGRIELQRGNALRARRSLLTAMELLADLPPTTEIPGTGGEQAGPLAEAAAELLQETKGQR